MGILTTNHDKAKKLTELTARLGMSTNLEWLATPTGVEELVSSDGKKVILDKLTGQSRAIEITTYWEERKRRGALPDFVVSMDVLPVVKNIPGLSDEQAVMKKPEAGKTALEAFCELFAMCATEIDDHNIQDDAELIDSLVVNYYLLQAFAPVDQVRGRVETERATAEWDTVQFTFSLTLVKFLADPGNIKSLSSNTELGEILGRDTTGGFRVQSFLPWIAQVAALQESDEMWMKILYGEHEPWGGSEVLVDKKCDLGQEMRVGREDGPGGRKGDKIQMMSVREFVGYAVKNITPRLLHKIFLRPGRGKKKT